MVIQTSRRPDGTRCVAEIASMAFDADRRRCALTTLYRREMGQQAGRWFDYPAWIDDLPAAAVADKKEVKQWIRSLDIRLSA